MVRYSLPKYFYLQLTIALSNCCFSANGAFFNRATVSSRCPCTRADFTCDYCFEVPEGVSEMQLSFYCVLMIVIVTIEN